ncbi:hypothetical protein ACSSS7_004542 [Eimeria intestinalis]
MWDDGEFSPRAPLDRSLGYFSSASPVSTGKRTPRGAPEVSETGKTPPSKHKPQQCPDDPIFINDVRALRQMAPFSSTEEQVLTRSQRRRSSVNLLQQLVAGQPDGLSEPQRTPPVPATQDRRGRKRRASSPGAPGYPCSLPRMEPIEESNATINFEGLSRAKGRRRQSPAQGASQEADSASLQASFQCSRRNSVATGEIARSSSGSSKIASPFQKLPPPSPSDFPLAFPFRGPSLPGSDCCSPRCAAAQAQDQQLHQVEGSARRAEKLLGNAPTELPKQSREGCPLGKSAPPFHCVHEVPSCPFDARKSPSCFVELLSSATSPLRSSEARAIPLPLGWGSPCSRETANQQRNGKPIHPKVSGRLLPTSGTRTLLDDDATANNAVSTPKKTVAIRRSSAAPLKASKNAAQGVGAVLAGVKGTSQPLADKEIIAQANVDESVASLLKTRGSNQTGQTQDSSAAALPIAADNAHQFGRRIVLSAPSTCTKKQQGRLNDFACVGLRSCNGAQSGSSVVLAAAAASGRRRSTGRRPSRLPADNDSPVCVTSDILSHAKRSLVWRPASQEVSAISQERPGVSELNLGDKEPAKSKAASSRQASWLKSRSRAGVSRPSPRLSSQGRILQAKTADATSGRSSKSGSKQGYRLSHASSKGATGPAMNSSWRRPVLAATTPFLAKKKLSSETSSSLQQRRSGLSVVGSRIRALPIGKSRNSTGLAAAKQQRGNAESATRAKPASTAVCVGGPHWHSGRTALERERVIPAATPAARVARPHRQPIQYAPPKRRTSAASRGSTKAPDSRVTPPGMPKPTPTGKPSEPATGGAQQDSLQSPDGLASTSNLRMTSESSPLPHKNLAHQASRCIPRSSIRSECAVSDKDCLASSAASPSLQRSQSASALSVVVAADKAEPNQGPTCRDRSPHERRRSSDPQYSLSQKAATDAWEGEREHHLRESVRRASSAWEASDCLEQRVTEHQQQHDAQQQEWENRDLEYQERQQNLLLEQQKRERLLAWEQREAELLKNRKALSKEEPSFWGFDPSSSRLNFAKVEQRVVPMAARQVHGPVPHERRRKSILRSSNGAQQSETRGGSRGISFSPFNKVQLYMLDEHERASKEAAANLSQQGEQRQQMRQKLEEQFQLMLLRGESDIKLSLLRRELAELCDPDEE